MGGPRAFTNLTSAALMIGFLVIASCKSSSSTAPNDPYLPAPGVCDTTATTIVDNAASLVFAVDDNYVYDAAVEGLLRTPRAGGDSTTLIPGDGISSVAVSSTNIYIMSEGLPTDGGSLAAGLYSLPLAGGAPQLLVPNQNATGPMLVVQDTVYWGGIFGVASYSSARGFNQTTLKDALAPIALATGPDGIYAGVNTLSIAGGAQSITGSVMRFPYDGSAGVTIVSGIARIDSIAVDATSMYLAFESGEIDRAALDGSGLGKLGSEGASVAVDASNLYFVANEGTTASISKMSKAGGAPTVVATSSKTPGDLLLYGGNVYWENNVGGPEDDPDPQYGVRTACK